MRVEKRACFLQLYLLLMHFYWILLLQSKSVENTVIYIGLSTLCSESLVAYMQPINLGGTLNEAYLHIMLICYAMLNISSA